MPRGFAGENESGRANDPSGFGGGADAGNKDFSDFAGSNNSGIASISYSNEDEALKSIQDAITKAQAKGQNVFGDTFQNTLAANMLAGNVPGIMSNYNYGDDNQEANTFIETYADSYRDPVTGNYSYKNPMAFIDTMTTKYAGFDPGQTFTQNLFNQMVPGNVTPLGILSAAPAVLGVDKVVSTGVSLGNALLGQLGIGTKPEEVTADTSISFEKVAADTDAPRTKGDIDVK